MTTSTIERIEKILDRINTHPEYSGNVKRERIESFRWDSVKHSADLEARSEAEHGIKGEKNPKVVFRNMGAAWDYLARYGIDVSSLGAIGRIIEPGSTKMDASGFRRTEVNLGIPYKDVQFAMQKLAEDINDINRLPSILRAIDAHIELLKIHPFVDGNGRAARLLQNFCLEQRGYPSAIIPAQEKNLYLGLVRGTINARFKDESTALQPVGDERKFHDYIEGKILTSVEHLEQELRKRRIYEVHLEGLGDNGLFKTVKRVLRSTGKQPGKSGVTVNVYNRNTRNGADLYVAGNVGIDEVEHKLMHLSDKYGIRYKLGIKKGCC